MGGKFLLTGGAGFIGSYIAKELVCAGDEVIIYDAFRYFGDPRTADYKKMLELRLKDLDGNPLVHIEHGDVRNRSRFGAVVDKYRPEVVLHLAALPRVDISKNLKEEAIQQNLYATVDVLEEILYKDFVKRFVYTSTSMVYGDFLSEPCPESQPCKPKEPYGFAKLASEVVVEGYFRHNNKLNKEYVIIRPSAVYGPTDLNRRVTQQFVENALEGKPLKLNNGGREKADFSYVEDVAHGFILAMKKEEARNETFNVTAGHGYSVKELAEIVAEFVPGVKMVEGEVDPTRPVRGTLDISKARKLLGYEPKVQLREGMAAYLDFVKKVKGR